MKTYDKPKRADYEEFLFRSVFKAYGPRADYLDACTKTSYRDFCRTMHGFGKLQNKKSIYDSALTTLQDQFRNIPSDQTVRDQNSFDNWHESVTKQIIQVFCDDSRDKSFKVFAGQLQKWINMTFKNIFVCGDQRVRGYDRLYEFCHMPIDNVILGQLKKMGIRSSNVWSKWNYPDYLEFQKSLRAKFNGQPLLNVEFFLYNEGTDRQ